ncbi:HD domain-containing protein [Micromonospora sp. NPDC049366]|uniref:HD domain-containing protein n=1 Tax=Micromonospora sp. NPDC049366 TaxID=3364271 RepID=UPI0037A2D027
MPEVIAGLEIPDTAAVAEATRLIQETTRPVIYHHSRRAFLFSLLHARKIGVQPDTEQLYLATMFHDTGLLTPFSDVVQRFEVDGADHARKFLVDRGFPPAAVETVWTAIALHTTLGIPERLGPEIAFTQLGIATDVIGLGLDGLAQDQLDEILAAHPRGDFKNEFLRAHVDGLKNRPETTEGTMNSDILEHFIPGFRRTTAVERILGAPWSS